MLVKNGMWAVSTAACIANPRAACKDMAQAGVEHAERGLKPSNPGEQGTCTCTMSRQLRTY